MSEKQVAGDEASLSLSYGELEKLLFQLSRATSDAAKSIIRSRYKNLQKLGMPFGERPAQGRRQKYNLQQVAEWVLAFQLLEFGIDQRHIMMMLSQRKSEDGMPDESDFKAGRRVHSIVLLVAGRIKHAYGYKGSPEKQEVIGFEFNFLERIWKKEPYYIFHGRAEDLGTIATLRHTAINLDLLACEVAQFMRVIHGIDT